MLSVRERVCVRDGKRKNGRLTDKEETQTDMENDKWREAVHFLLKCRAPRVEEYAFQKRSFAAARCINAVIEYMGVNLYFICWPEVN